jgi:hypothetical protein
MKRIATTGLGVLALALCMVGIAASQRPAGPKGKGPGKKGPPPKGFVLGKLLPPHILEELELTAEQEKQLRELEQETRKKLEKIFTKDQRQLIEKLGKRRPPGPGPRGEDDDPPPPPGKGKGKRPPKEDDAEAKLPAKSTGGIAWFATWKDALVEAKRSGKPILLVSAAPHCAGVSGIW